MFNSRRKKLVEKHPSPFSVLIFLKCELTGFIFRPSLEHLSPCVTDLESESAASLTLYGTPQCRFNSRYSFLPECAELLLGQDCAELLLGQVGSLWMSP